MRARALASLLLAGAFAGCASLPSEPPPDPAQDEEPVALSASVALIESPPIEPVEPPIEPEPARALVVTAPAPAVAPAAVAPPTAPAPQESLPPSISAPGSTVFAAAAPTRLPDLTPRLQPEDEALLVLVFDLQRYNGLGPDELKREFNAMSTQLGRERSDANRVRLAVLFTLTHGNPQDDQRALQLLENVAKSGGGATPVKSLAAVLAMQINDRVRMVRDEQKKATEALQKLEALREMERSLLRDRVRSGGGGGGGSGGR